MMSDQEMRQKLKRAFAVNPERRVVLEWMLEEWDAYASPKFFTGGPPDDHEEEMQSRGWDRAGWWTRQVLQYLDRASTYLVSEVLHGSFTKMNGEVSDTYGNPERGRQAAMKALTTLFDGNACMIRNHGLPPAPGSSSTEDPIPWER